MYLLNVLTLSVLLLVHADMAEGCVRVSHNCTGVSWICAWGLSVTGLEALGHPSCATHSRPTPIRDAFIAGM